MTTQTQDLSQALVLSDRQFSILCRGLPAPLDEQMPHDSDVFEVSRTGLPFAPTAFVLVEPSAAAVATQTTTTKAKKDGSGTT